MLHTGQGDGGKTKIFNCDHWLSKGSPEVETLGSLDEINSFLGWCKAVAEKEAVGRKVGEVAGESLTALLTEAQNGLFLVQAELAGADKRVSARYTRRMEAVIAAVEKEIPPIKSFVLSGGCELSAMFDFGRTIARRAEGLIVRAQEKMSVQPETLAFMNRLSSFLYALARLVNHRAGIGDRRPTYEN